MLSARNIAALGFMTFAMYLGAGNLIFPPFWVTKQVKTFEWNVWIPFNWRGPTCFSTGNGGDR